jgi:hypothetical protein
MKFFKRVRDFFCKKKPEEKGLIYNTRPEIPARVPIVNKPMMIEAGLGVDVNNETRLSIETSCSLCKFAVHDTSLDDMKSVICTVNPNKPIITTLDYTCPKHKPKYGNLKVIVDKGTLLEYDTEEANTRAQPITGQERTYKDAGIKEIGEEEWQL